MTDAPVHTPSDFGGHKRNADGTIEGWTPPVDVEPTREDRVSAFLDALDHAMMHNAPVSPQMLADAKSLLGA